VLPASNTSGFNRRHAYVVDVAADMARHFLTRDGTPGVRGLVVAGAGPLKTDLLRLGPRLLRPVLLDLVAFECEVAYGGRVGFHEAVRKSATALRNHAMIDGERVTQRLMDAVARDSGGAGASSYVLGARETMRAVASGAVATLLVSDCAAVEVDMSGLRDGAAIDALEEPRRFTAAHGATTAKSGQTCSLARWLLRVERDAQRARDSGSAANAASSASTAENDTLALALSVNEVHLIKPVSGATAQFHAGLGGVAALLRYPMDITVFDDPVAASFKKQAHELEEGEVYDDSSSSSREDDIIDEHDSDFD
jgi:peptide subunit release factor 1 (eRF1)